MVLEETQEEMLSYLIYVETPSTDADRRGAEFGHLNADGVAWKAGVEFDEVRRPISDRESA